MTDEPPYLVRTARIQEDAGKLLYYMPPEDGWTSRTLEYRKVGPVGEAVITSAFADGTTEPLPVPRELIRVMKDLRHEMAEQGKGAWLSTVMRVDNKGQMNCSYNYDEKPTWLAPIEDKAYVMDLEKYPRPDEAIPPWLRQLING
ncbi:Uncharacterised protein [Mycobacteroides abscessus subsp. abscessus]|uniref:Uncharacterized protein n=2 Tax=Mycobacteroides abscessus TaxID=36809 RepID=A0AB38CWC9_9MYCO|nr:immunity protein YezG family protein [Mycobacteroides abscessus]MDM2320930.1 DUF600 family protein [Mycobacteroides abscessus]MDM2325980.1 DUF600 family protein [Mycobacteroides abscessus]MDM2330800.1 DUF600 family protein [Mycobacteroides abscessus]MDM2335772.1 DUF600 family protein [Mycobacteroides abscessus]MDM2340938.1 DUF600 family protein [Mycobacteroides abscessus]